MQLVLGRSSYAIRMQWWGWIGSLQHRLILLLGINHLLIYNQINSTAQDGKCPLWSGMLGSARPLSWSICNIVCGEQQDFARSSPPPPPHYCFSNSQRCQQSQVVLCSSVFLRRNSIPRGTAVSLKDLHFLTLVEEILNDLLTK